MEVKIDVKLTEKEMFSFLMHHSYSSFGGYVGVALSICALMGLFYTWKMPAVTLAYKLVLLVTALLFTVIQPIMLYYKACRQIKRNESFRNVIQYKFNPSLIEISQDEAKISFEWNDVTKVTSNKKIVIIYIGRMRAFVLPKRCIGDRYNDLKELIYKYSGALQIRMK